MIIYFICFIIKIIIFAAKITIYLISYLNFKIAEISIVMKKEVPANFIMIIINSTWFIDIVIMKYFLEKIIIADFKIIKTYINFVNYLIMENSMIIMKEFFLQNIMNIKAFIIIMLDYFYLINLENYYYLHLNSIN